MNRKRAAGQASFYQRIRFSTVAMDNMGPLKMATGTRTRPVLVLIDLFTINAFAVPLVSTDSADVACEKMENWALNFDAPNVFCTDQRRNFGGKLIQEICFGYRQNSDLSL